MVAVTGCTWVGNAQYNDRQAELDEARVELVPATDNVELVFGSPNRFYWVSLEKPLDEPLLHSYEPESDTRFDYEATRGDTNLEDWRASDRMIVDCGFSRAIAYDADTGQQLGQLDADTDLCAVDDEFLFYIEQRKVMSWVPGGTPTEVLDLDAAGVGTGSLQFSVEGTTMVLAEGPRVWHLDLGTRTATWLENEDPVTGTVVFDATGVVYDSSEGPRYIAFADRSTFLLEDAIADGGYEIGGDFTDVHQIDQSTGEMGFFANFLVYRSVHGIFAYDLLRKKTIDILLDPRGEDVFDDTPTYRSPVVAGGTLFVQERPEFGSARGAIYSVDLEQRLLGSR